jgi:hypothetical protein
LTVLPFLVNDVVVVVVDDDVVLEIVDFVGDNGDDDNCGGGDLDKLLAIEFILIFLNFTIFNANNLFIRNNTNKINKHVVNIS